ncbi:MAG: hypothetical protein KBF62_03305 [Candidatus Pacebacteria bacterium]|nr:hypothetical protein [Candidatus Paceibacterota bacterium]MBP9058638.1 hypothetical protein [Candidatus Paceibacterota bacterium]
MKTNFVNMTRTDKALDRGIMVAMLVAAIASYVLMPVLQAKILCVTLFGCGAIMSLAITSKNWSKLLFFISFAVFAIGVIYTGI